jgi:hypothetical protein
MDCAFAGCMSLKDIQLFAAALDAQPQEFVLSLSPGGGAPATLAGQVRSVAKLSTMVRTTGDFWDRWAGPDGLRTHYNQSASLVAAGLSSGTAGAPFLDLDMLPLGRIGQPIVGNDPLVGRPRQSNFTHPEALAVMSLWIIARSPLIFGGSLTETKPPTLALLQATEALAVQDEATNSRQLWQSERAVVWVADSKSNGGANRTVFAGVFSLVPENSTLHLSAAVLGLKGCTGTVEVRSVWGRLAAARLHAQVQRGAAAGGLRLGAPGEFSHELQPRGGDLLRLSCATLKRDDADSERKTTTIRNDVPRRDTDGQILAVADGNLVYARGRYYLYGVRYQPCIEPDVAADPDSNGKSVSCYVTGGTLGPPEWAADDRDCSAAGLRKPGTCCGWRNMTFAVYSSADLRSWSLLSRDVLPAMTDPASPYSSARQMMSVPAALWNRRTGKFVLWFQHVLRTTNSTTGIATGVKAVAVSDTPQGPFVVHLWDASAGVPGMLASTGQKVWATAEGEAYMAHNGAAVIDGWPKGQYVSKLSPDFLSIVGSSVVFGEAQGFTEGGGIFERGGRWYVMAGHGCCFCDLGSNGYVWSTADPLRGPWEFQGDVIARQGNLSVTKAQQFSVSGLVLDNDTVVPMFTGVRFGSAPDGNKQVRAQPELAHTPVPASLSTDGFAALVAARLSVLGSARLRTGGRGAPTSVGGQLGRRRDTQERRLPHRKEDDDAAPRHERSSVPKMAAGASTCSTCAAASASSPTRCTRTTRSASR